MRYPMFKDGERCKVLPSIFSESPDWAQSLLRGTDMTGTVLLRHRRYKGRRPVYAIESYGRIYDIYANHLAKIDKE